MGPAVCLLPGARGAGNPPRIELQAGFLFMPAAYVMTSFFDDWKRFCFVLREIASGENGRPLVSFEAQERAQAVLIERGYTWPGQAAAPTAPIAVPDILIEIENEFERPRRTNKLHGR
jgi:hypothetical protein